MKKALAVLPFLAIVAFASLLWLPDRTPHSGTFQLPPAPPSRNADPAPNARHREDLLVRHDSQVMKLADPATGRLPQDIRRLELEFAAHMPRRQGNEKSLTWSFHGPANVGGRTRALGIDVADPGFNTLLAGGVSGGMWRSEDGGLNWDLTTGSSQIHHVSSVAQDTRPGHRNVWYYGTGEGEGGSASRPTSGFLVHPGDGIYKSTDGGRNWSVLATTAGADPQAFTSPWQVVWRLDVDASETIDDEVYAATWGGIYRSTDGGSSWTHVLGDPTTPASYADLAISPTGVVYATLSYDGAQHGTFRSTDGVTWTDITPPGYTDYDRIVLAIAPSDETIVWFLVANTWTQPDAALFRYQYLSGNGAGGGGMWLDRSSQLATLPGTYGASHYETQGSYCQMLAVNPTDPETVYLGGVYLHRSTDGFQLANNTSLMGGWGYAVHHADLHGLVFQPGSSAIAYSASDGGVHRTANADAGTVVWTTLNQGYNTSQFYTVAIDENLPGNPAMIGGTQDNGSLFSAETLPAGDWAEELQGDGGFCAVADASGSIGTYYMSYQQNYGVFRMRLDNADGALQTVSRIDPPAADTSLWLKPFILDPGDATKMFLAADDALWRNSDLTGIPTGNAAPTGVNWSVLTQAPPGQAISALSLSRSASRILYFGTAGGQLHRLDNAATAPPGSTPVRLDIGAGFPDGAYVSSIAVHHDDDQRVLVAFSNYNVVNVFYSADGGSNWMPVEGNLGGANSPSIRSVAWLPVTAVDYCLVATSTGIYSTINLDGSATIWLLEAADVVGNAVVDMLAVRPADALVVAGTHGRGVVRGTLGISPVGEPTLPPVVRLDQNVPNPFNPTTTIRFAIPRDGRVTIVVYDIAGHRVRKLLNEFRQAGDHTVAWNGNDDDGRPVGSGTYLSRIRSGGQEDTGTMTLVR